MRLYSRMVRAKRPPRGVWLRMRDGRWKIRYPSSSEEVEIRDRNQLKMFMIQRPAKYSSLEQRYQG